MSKVTENTRKVLFHTTRVGFGALHLAVQATADLLVEVETAIVSKTGYEDHEGRMQYFTPGQVEADDYRASRRAITNDTMDRGTIIAKRVIDKVRARARAEELKTA